MIRPVTLVCLALAAGSGLYLYQVKQRAFALDAQMRLTFHDIDTARERTRMMRADWALMNDPQRLQALSDQYLQLKPMAPSQLMTMDQLASALPAPVAPRPDQPLPAVTPLPAPDGAPGTPMAAAGGDTGSAVAMTMPAPADAPPTLAAAASPVTGEDAATDPTLAAAPDAGGSQVAMELPMPPDAAPAPPPPAAPMATAPVAPRLAALQVPAVSAPSMPLARPKPLKSHRPAPASPTGNDMAAVVSQPLTPSAPMAQVAETTPKPLRHRKSPAFSHVPGQLYAENTPARTMQPRITPPAATVAYRAAPSAAPMGSALGMASVSLPPPRPLYSNDQ